MDLGGTNFRVLVVRVAQDGIRITSEIYAIPTTITQGTGEAVRLRTRGRGTGWELPYLSLPTGPGEGWEPPTTSPHLGP